MLSVVGLSYDAVRKLPHEGLEEFTRETGIQVDFIPTFGDSKTQLALIQRTVERHASVPDVYLIDAVWTGSLGSHLLDLTPYLDNNAREHLPDLLKNNSMDGRLVALPFYLNVGMLFYRTDLLKKYGYKGPPHTWDEMERMATRIQYGERAGGKSGFWGYIFQGASYEGLTCNALEWQMSFEGGRIIEPDGTVTVNNAQTAAALEKASAWIGSISPASVLSYTEADSLNAFRSGNAAFMRYWSSGYNAIASYPALQGRFDVALLPSGSHRRAQTMGGFQLAVSAYSAHPREAAQLVLFLSGSNVQKRRAVEEGYLPTLPRLYNDGEVLKAVPEASVLKNIGLVNWIARPSTVAGGLYADVSQIYYEGVHMILSRQGRTQDVLPSIEKQMIALSSKFHSRR